MDRGVAVINPTLQAVDAPVGPTWPTGLSEPRRSAAIAAVLVAMTLAVLDAAIVNVALPSIARSNGFGGQRGQRMGRV